jgi:hypothetical protein
LRSSSLSPIILNILKWQGSRLKDCLSSGT